MLPYLLLLNLLFCCIMLVYHYLMLCFNVNQSLYNQWNRTTPLHDKFNLIWNLIGQFLEINQLSEFTDIANVRAHPLFTMMFRFNIVSFTVALIVMPHCWLFLHVWLFLQQSFQRSPIKCWIFYVEFLCSLLRNCDFLCWTKKDSFFGFHLFAFNIFEIQTNNVVKDVRAV